MVKNIQKSKSGIPKIETKIRIQKLKKKDPEKSRKKSQNPKNPNMQKLKILKISENPDSKKNQRIKIKNQKFRKLPIKTEMKIPTLE